MSIDAKVIADLDHANRVGNIVTVSCDPEAIPYSDTVTGRILCLAYSKVQYEQARDAGESFSGYLPQYVIVDTDTGFVAIDAENVHGLAESPTPEEPERPLLRPGDV